MFKKLVDCPILIADNPLLDLPLEIAGRLRNEILRTFQSEKAFEEDP
jgi:hypothetical protein